MQKIPEMLGSIKSLQSPGIEPGSTAWQAAIIPLNQDCTYERVF